MYNEIISRLKEKKELSLILDDIVQQAEIPFVDIEKTKKRPETKEKIRTLQEKLKKDFNRETLTKYANTLFLLQMFEDALKIYGELYKRWESQNAVFKIGEIMRQEGLYEQSRILFERGLSYSPEEIQGIHLAFHYGISDIIGGVHENNDSISKYGFEIEKLGFKFEKGKGFYLPDFDYNCFSLDYEEVGMMEGLERALAGIHLNLGKEQRIKGQFHSADNCPYLKYIDRRKTRVL